MGLRDAVSRPSRDLHGFFEAFRKGLPVCVLEHLHDVSSPVARPNSARAIPLSAACVLRAWPSRINPHIQLPAPGRNTVRSCCGTRKSYREQCGARVVSLEATDDAFIRYRSFSQRTMAYISCMEAWAGRKTRSGCDSQDQGISWGFQSVPPRPMQEDCIVFRLRFLLDGYTMHSRE